MAFISINPEEARKYVSSVSEYASLINKEGKKIHDKSEGNNHPVSTVEAATKPSGIPPHVFVSDPSKPAALGAASFMGGLQNSAASTMANTIDGHAMQLVNYASEVEYRRLEVVYLNSNGVASYNADGTLSYYLPDPPEGQDPEAYWAKMDTSENVAQYNSVSVENGKNAAKKLEEAVNSEDEAAISKQLEEINKHRDVPAYSSMFCQTMGVPNMMDAPLKIQGDLSYVGYKPDIIDGLTDTFGHMMAAASTLYDENSSKPGVAASGSKTPWNLRQEIYNAVVDKPGRATVLDAVMTAEGTVYDTDFLVDLASDMEKIPSWPPEQTKSATDFNVRNSSYYLNDHTTDPLAAVLHGMGNNPEAANEYLASADSDDPMLGGNDSDDLWAPSTAAKNRMQMLASRNWTPESLRGLSAAFAAASSERIPAPGSDKDDRATWATANGITILAQQNIYDHEVKHNVGVMLGNCGPEVTGVANERGVVPAKEEPYKMVPITVNGGDASKLNKSVARLMLDVSSSGEATYEVVRGATAYAARRADAGTQMRGADRDDIQRVYQDDMSVIDLFTSLNQSNSSSAYNGAAAAAGLLSIVPGTGQAAGITSAIASAGLTLSGQPEVDPNFKFNEKNALDAAAYTNAISAGLIDNVPSTPEELSANTWYTVDSNGKAHVSLDDSTKVKQFNAWVSAGAGKNEPTDYNGDGTVDDDEKNRNTAESKSAKTVSSFRQIKTPARDWSGVEDFKEANHL